jgi:hypothetical protein
MTVKRGTSINTIFSSGTPGFAILLWEKALDIPYADLIIMH